MPCNYLPSKFSVSNVANCKINNIIAPCWDMYVGSLSSQGFNPNTARYQNPQNYSIDYVANSVICESKIINDKIVCIIESPHRDEYKFSNSNGFAASGKTGKLFDAKFATLYAKNHSPINQVYDIVLANSVQFQCSNGLSLNNRTNQFGRDLNWQACMNDQYIQKDLIGRLSALKPKIIINLCTKGLINMQLMLDRVIQANLTALGNPMYLYGTHPCTWNCSYAYIQ